jgi:hypothetical protein
MASFQEVVEPELTVWVIVAAEANGMASIELTAANRRGQVVLDVVDMGLISGCIIWFFRGGIAGRRRHNANLDPFAYYHQRG